MSKLIYVDRLKKDILDLPNCYNGFSDAYDKACIIGVIDEQPTIEERKKGMWIDDCSCSVCHWIHKNDDCCVLLTDYKYCPNCGARMVVKHE